MPYRCPGRCRLTGFSLVELLVVLAITAILASLAIPAISGMTRAYQLGATCDLLINQLTLARQAALSNSHLVQVRLYRIPDYGQDVSGNRTTYRAIQCFVEGDAPATGKPQLTPITKVILFPSPAVISTQSSPNVSPLLSGSPTSAVSTDPSLPIYGNNYDYFSFHYKPDGSTDLNAGANSITLVSENDKSGGTGLPTNYRTIQIDPAIGTVRRFSP